MSPSDAWSPCLASALQLCGQLRRCVSASPLRMCRHIRGEILLNVEGLSEDSGKPQITTNPHTQSFSQHRYLALPLTTVTSLSTLATGQKKCCAKFPAPGREIGRRELMLGREKSQYKFQMSFQEKVFLAETCYFNVMNTAQF